jgi:hypothetical protein
LLELVHGRPVVSASQGGAPTAPALGSAWSPLLLLLVPILFSSLYLAGVHKLGTLGFDFRGTLWDPAKAILSGHSPYPPPHPAALRTGNPSVYPPAVMLVVIPLTVLPWSAALAVWLALTILAAGTAFWLLGVRDRVVYLVALCSAPFLIGFVYGNLTVLLLLGLAIAWRWRDRPGITGAAVAALIVAKVFLWPLLIWLVVTRRLRAAAYAGGFAVLAGVGSWAIIGFDGFRSYPALLRALDNVYSSRTQSLAALWLRLGLSQTEAVVLALLAGITILGVGTRLARRTDGDRRMYSAAVLAAIVASPLSWIHYYSLLLVTLVLYRRTATRVWYLPSLYWIVILAFAPKSPAPGRPPDIPKPVWLALTTVPPVAYLLGLLLLCAATGFIVLRADGGQLHAPEIALHRGVLRSLVIGDFRLREVATAGECPTHGIVQAVKQVPVFSPPGLFWAIRRAASVTRSYRCPECGTKTRAA